MKLYSLALNIAPLTGKIIKNRRRVFERGEDLLQNGMLHFVFLTVNCQKSIFKVRIYV